MKGNLPVPSGTTANQGVRMKTEPLARSADLIVDSIGDELLVYDTSSSRAHSLNAVVAAVWKACDGTRSPEQIAAHTGLDPAAVELALDNLAEIELISGHKRTGISRRSALRRITVGAAGLTVGAAAAGGVAAALPVIRSITAPTAAKAVSNCTAVFNKCTLTTDCCSGHCSGDGFCRSSPAVGSGQPCDGVNQCEIGSQCVCPHDSCASTSYYCSPTG